MKLADLPNMPATESENVSRGMFVECLCRMGWRTYPSADREGATELIDRFLAHHARVPGALSHVLHGIVPISVFRFVDEQQRTFEGAAFLNGAVVRVSRGDTEAFYLFVDDETAQTWGYPTNYTTYQPQ